MTYELRQRLQLDGDYDADFLAEFFVEKTDLRLVYDNASGDYLLLEFLEQPEPPALDEWTPRGDPFPDLDDDDDDDPLVGPSPTYWDGIDARAARQRPNRSDGGDA